MPYFALFYDVVNDFETKRAPFRQDHLRYARQAHACGELFLAGTLANPEGALLVFHTEDRAVAESFARQDPYVVNGLVARWEIRPWTVVIGGTEAPSSALQLGEDDSRDRRPRLAGAATGNCSTGQSRILRIDKRAGIAGECASDL